MPVARLSTPRFTPLSSSKPRGRDRAARPPASPTARTARHTGTPPSTRRAGGGRGRTPQGRAAESWAPSAVDAEPSVPEAGVTIRSHFGVGYFFSSQAFQKKVNGPERKSPANGRTQK